MAFHQQLASPVYHQYREHEVDVEVEAKLDERFGNQALCESIPSQETSRTIIFSRLSDWGSFDAIKSALLGEGGVDYLDEDGELDSLDEGLRAFQDPISCDLWRRLDQSGGSILPTHDGLGGFDRHASPLQEQIWRFERHNPNRRDSRSEGLLKEEEHPFETTRLERIQQWRLDQSLGMLEEVEQGIPLARVSSVGGNPLLGTKKQRSLRQSDDTTPLDLASLTGSAHVEVPSAKFDREAASFWHSLARRFIEDVMGIDDTILTVILGESLLMDEKSYLPRLQPKVFGSVLSKHRITIAEDHPAGWDDGLLLRLARELRSFARQLHGNPYAPNSMLHPHLMDYGGLPIAPKLMDSDQPSAIYRVEASRSADFIPTLQKLRAEHGQDDDTECWDVEDDNHSTPSELNHAGEADYWEQTPSWRSIFGYLQHRFLSQQHSARPISSTPNLATTHSPNSIYRTAIIKRCHPLVSRAASAAAKPHGTYDRSARSPPPPLPRRLSNSLLSSSLKRPGSTCASLSTKRSKREASLRSRNYWDLGESAGSDCAGGFAGLGAWGEV